MKWASLFAYLVLIYMHRHNKYTIKEMKHEHGLKALKQPTLH